jgi:hypothetical protein
MSYIHHALNAGKPLENNADCHIVLHIPLSAANWYISFHLSLGNMKESFTPQWSVRVYRSYLQANVTSFWSAIYIYFHWHVWIFVTKQKLINASVRTPYFLALPESRNFHINIIFHVESNRNIILHIYDEVEIISKCKLWFKIPIHNYKQSSLPFYNEQIDKGQNSSASVLICWTRWR